MVTKKFTIDRKRWLRGEGSETSYLHRLSDGKQCCLGFYLEACGVKRVDIVGVGSPVRLLYIPDEAKWLEVNEGEGSRPLVAANDALVLKASTRESRITNLFREHGVAVEFVGDES